jgi:hypothetical protein
LAIETQKGFNKVGKRLLRRELDESNFGWEPFLLSHLAIFGNQADCRRSISFFKSHNIGNEALAFCIE